MVEYRNSPDLSETPPSRQDACVANTIVSLCSNLSGRKLDVPSILYEWRRMMDKDMIRMYASHQRRSRTRDTSPKPRPHYDDALLRLAQRSIVRSINALREGRGVPISLLPLQTVLQDSEVNFNKGGTEKIMKEVNLGRQVAASFQVQTEDGEKYWHIAHLGFSDGPKLVSLSDGNTPITPEVIESINLSAQHLNKVAHTWNFVSINKFGD